MLIFAAHYNINVRTQNTMILQLTCFKPISSKTILTAFALLLACTRLLAQPFAQTYMGRQYYFQTFERRDGLSHNTVNKIIQDRLGFMWFGTKDGLDRMDGTFFKVFNKENSKLGNNTVTEIFEDRGGNLWIGTDEGLYVYNPITESFFTIKEYSNSALNITHTVTHIKEDTRRNIWFSVDQEGLYCFNTVNHRLTRPYNSASQKRAMPNISDFSFVGRVCWIAFYNDNLYYSTDGLKTLKPYKDHNGNMFFHKSVVNNIKQRGNDMYLCTSYGLFVLNTKGRTLRKLLDGYVRTVEFTGQELWAGTEKGICIYNTATGTMNRITASDGNDPYALSDNAIYTIFKDREGGIWIGSYFGGVNYYPIQRSYFEKYYPHEGMTFMGRRVREFCKSNDGTIWIGTEDKGLFNFNPHTRRLTPFSSPKIYPNIHGLCLDGNYLWVGTFSGGLNRLDLRTHQVKNYRQSDAPNKLLSNGIFSMCRTREGQLWIGTISGLLTYNRATDDFTRIPQLKEVFVDFILEDKDGTIWLATYANGVFRYDPKSKKWRNYKHNPKDNTSLSYNRVISICQDSQGRLWFLTQGGGICRYNPKKDSFTRIDMSDGLPSNIVYKMVEDGKGRLWVSTSNGLVRLNPNDRHMKVYTTADGLLSDQFNYQSGLWNYDNGMIYMGCINGFIAFNPDTFNDNTPPSPVYITDLYIHDKHATVGGKDSPLKRSLLYSNEITLSADQNTIALEVADLNLRPSEKNNLQYKLEGFDNDWQTVTSDGVIYYQNLPYRHYTLKIRGINREGKPDGQERSLEINVLPPFYMTGWAYAFYFLLAITLATYLVHRMRVRMQNKQKQAMRIFEREKERELYISKITFFTNITHEIRTPLTLIKGPLDDICSKFKDVPTEMREDLKVMGINTDRLLTLVNQLLDFRKNETNGLKLNFFKTDVSQLIKKICTTFTPTLSNRQIRFDIEIPDGIEATIDIEAFTKIVSNLLSNAMKHAESYIKIKVEVSNAHLKVTIENDGDLIPPAMRESIFKPFVQYKDTKQNAGFGTGLGLTLARSLAELHHGTLAMDDSEQTNRFVLSLPVVQDTGISVLTDETETELSEETEPTVVNTCNANDRRKYTLLIVEDNNDMRNFIVKTLAPLYTILTAKDGVEAIEVLKENVVNLIISDIMMPNMDGIALCTWVKTTIDYSHIPVILLTAKTALSSKIEGTRQGADAYIEKPFSIEYLKAETENLLNTREQLRQLFINSPYTQTDSVSTSKLDSEFLKNVHQVIMNNLSNADFSFDDLASSLNMSKSSFSRKFRGLFDLTPNDYVKLERLKHAAVLLKENNTRINEICYKCGFNTPSYFTKCFYKQFGVLPKDFAEKTD